MDSFLLARFAQWKSSDVVCDLGAGTGILTLLALLQGKVQRATAVEIQKDLIGYLKDNRLAFGLETRLEIHWGDWRRFGVDKPVPKYTVVISNPPYQSPGTGRASPDSSRRAACQELHGGLESLVKCARRVLSPEGRFYCIYPPARLEELLFCLREAGLKAQRLAAVHPYQDRPARHMLVEAVRAPRRELRVEPPVVIYRDPDHYEPEIEAYLGPKRRR